jgi:hypothetical protein
MVGKNEKKKSSAAKRRISIDKTAVNMAINVNEDEIIVVAQVLVTTTYSRAEREMIRMLSAAAIEKVTGIKRYTVQRFIDGRSMNKDTVLKLVRIIESLKQL